MQLAFQLTHVATTQLCISPQSNSSKSMQASYAHGDSINKTPANNEYPLFILVVVHLFHFLTINAPLAFWSQLDFLKIKSIELFQAEYFYVLEIPFIVTFCETVLNGCLINEDYAFCTEIKYFWCCLDNRAFPWSYIQYNIIGICSYVSSFTFIALVQHWALPVQLVARQRWQKALWIVNRKIQSSLVWLFTENMTPSFSDFYHNKLYNHSLPLQRFLKTSCLLTSGPAILGSTTGPF